MPVTDVTPLSFSAQPFLAVPANNSRSSPLFACGVSIGTDLTWNDGRMQVMGRDEQKQF